MQRIIRAGFFLLVIVVAGCVRPWGVNTRPAQPGQAFNNLADDGAWCWFADPRAVYYQADHKRIYIGYVNKQGDVNISCYDHETKKVTTATLKEKLQYDDHANPAILILPDGRLMVFYCAHNGNQMWYRLSKNPEDITAWEAERTIGTNTKGTQGYTYPNPIQLANENNRIYLFWRGGNFKPNFSESSDGVNWTPVRTLIKGTGDRPYIKFESDGREKIHFAFTDGHPKKHPQNCIYYGCYQNRAFYRADGSKITDIDNLPSEPIQAEKVYDAAVSGRRAWIWDIAIDSGGNPVIVYSTISEQKDHHYRYARWNGVKWQDYAVAPAGRWFPQTRPGKTESEPYYSGGIVLDHADTSVVYLSREVNGVFEIERWQTTNGGAAWTSRSITAGSEKNNVRPVIPRSYKPGRQGIFWMHGDYIYFWQYHTAIKTNLPIAYK